MRKKRIIRASLLARTDKATRIPHIPDPNEEYLHIRVYTPKTDLTPGTLHSVWNRAEQSSQQSKTDRQTASTCLGPAAAAATAAATHAYRRMTVTTTTTI